MPQNTKGIKDSHTNSDAESIVSQNGETVNSIQHNRTSPCVLVKSYPKGNMNSKFYLHEVIKIEALSNNAEEQFLTRVSDTAEHELHSTEDSASKESVSQNNKNVNNKDSSVDKATRLIDHYFTPVHEHEAEKVRNENEYLDKVAKLKLSQKIEKGNKTSESFAVQFLGEVNSDLEMLTSRKYISEKARAKINELKKQKEIFLRENPKLDYDKINNAISEFRTIYDELFVKMNEARIRNGYAPVEYRKGYFPHFLNLIIIDIENVL